MVDLRAATARERFARALAIFHISRAAPAPPSLCFLIPVGRTLYTSVRQGLYRGVGWGPVSST